MKRRIQPIVTIVTVRDIKIYPSSVGMAHQVGIIRGKDAELNGG
jgi:hypothetical protein